MIKFPVPILDDHDTGPFWQAAQDGALTVLFCEACQVPVHLPMPRCPSCGGTALEWREVGPAGILYTYTVVEQAVHPAFPAPYTVVLVELEDAPGVRLLGSIPGRPPLEIGMQMKCIFSDVPGARLPNWQPS